MEVADISLDTSLDTSADVENADIRVVHKRRKRSAAWVYFDKEDQKSGKSRCSLCDTEVKHCSNTSNLFKHLELKHPEEFRKCQVERGKELEVKKEKLDRKMAVGGSPSSSRSAEVEYKPVRAAKPLYMKKSDNSLLNMLACDMQPLAIVEYPGFMSYINSMGSHVRLPSKQTLINTLLPAKYAEVQKNVLLMLSQARHVALSGDLWLTSTSVEHLCVNAHFINNDWEIKSFALGMIFSLGQCSIEELAERLNQLVERWQITKKVSCFVSSRNIKLSTAAKLRNWSHLCCFSDSLNLAVKDSLRANEDLMQLQKACCNLVLLIQSTVMSTSNMGTILEQINFPDVKLAQHYWTTMVEMLDCMATQKLTVAAVLCMMNKSSLTLNPETVRAIEVSLAVLKPIQKFVKEISSKDHMFLSEVLPFVDHLQNMQSTDLSAQLVEELSLQARRRLFALQHSNLTMVAGLLDPRIKNKPPGAQIPPPPPQPQTLIQQSNSSDSEVKPLMSPGVVPGTPTAAASNDSLPMDEVTGYLESGVVDSSENPLLWWKENESVYPRLASLARKYLCIPANSVAPARIFSGEGETVLEKRNRIEPECIDAMLFLNKNIQQ